MMDSGNSSLELLCCVHDAYLSAEGPSDVGLTTEPYVCRVFNTAAVSGCSGGCIAGAAVNNLSCSGGRSDLVSVEKVVCPA